MRMIVVGLLMLCWGCGASMPMVGGLAGGANRGLAQILQQSAVERAEDQQARALDDEARRSLRQRDDALARFRLDTAAGNQDQADRDMAEAQRAQEDAQRDLEEANQFKAEADSALATTTSGSYYSHATASSPADMSCSTFRDPWGGSNTTCNSNGQRTMSCSTWYDSLGGAHTTCDP
jgi:hypothetical protein